MAAAQKKCTRCNFYLLHVYAIYKLNYYCIPCFGLEKEDRRAAIEKLPNIEDKDPPLGWLHKFEEDDIDTVWAIMSKLEGWES